MLNFRALIDSFRDCGCGMDHRCGIHDIRIGSGLVTQVGEILRENGFPRRLLLIGDRDTLAAAAGIEESLTGFEVTRHCYDTLRVATMDDVRLVEDYLDRVDAVVAVGAGSIHDPSRLACARRNKPLCLFATAPSMDGFASYNAPIVDGGFKTTHAAKCPEVIIADTKILAAAPKALKSAGFGDMISKYIALIDWQVSHTGHRRGLLPPGGGPDPNRRGPADDHGRPGDAGGRGDRGGGAGVAADDRHCHELHPDLPARQRHGAYSGPLLGVHRAAGGEDPQFPRRGRGRGHAADPAGVRGPGQPGDRHGPTPRSTTGTPSTGPTAPWPGMCGSSTPPTPSPTASSLAS